MKKLLALTFVSAAALLAFDYHLKPVQVSPSVKCFFGDSGEPNHKNGGNMVNTCAIDAGDQTIIIDSGPTAPYAQQVVSALGKKSPPVTTVIDTHFHDDHLGGNSFYGAQNITIIGHKKILDHYEVEGERFSRMKNFVTPDAYGDTTVALPTLTLEKTHTIATQKGDIVVMNLTQKGHTDTDVVVYFPKEKILFAGDLVFNDRIFPTRDGSLSGWLAAIDALSKINYKILIPGHGTNLSKKGYAMTKEYITSLRSQVAKAMDEGADMTNIASKVDMSKFSKYPLYKELNGKNIQRAYELLEMGEQ